MRPCFPILGFYAHLPYARRHEWLTLSYLWLSGGFYWIIRLFPQAKWAQFSKTASLEPSVPASS